MTGIPDRGVAGRGRQPDGQLRPVGHRVPVPAPATPARSSTRWPAGRGCDLAFDRLHRTLTAARSGDEDPFAALQGTRYEVEALTQLFKSADRPTRTLLGSDASEPELGRLAASGELARFGFIHLATHRRG